MVIGDCRKDTDFPNAAYDRVLAMHVLEHLPDLPRALDEVHRLLRTHVVSFVVIPCEGGLAYTIARDLSARQREPDGFPAATLASRRRLWRPR